MLQQTMLVWFNLQHVRFDVPSEILTFDIRLRPKHDPRSNRRFGDADCPH